jgi:hypothetical protein
METPTKKPAEHLVGHGHHRQKEGQQKKGPNKRQNKHRSIESSGANNTSHQSQKKGFLIHKLSFVVLVQRGLVQLLRSVSDQP